MGDQIFLDLSKIWLSSLQASGYRITEPRRAIVEILATSHRALEPVDVFDIGRRQYPSLGLVTVYRTLYKLEELELVQRVHHPNGCRMYLRAAQGHEHLLLCLSCGKAEYFSGDDLSGLIHQISSRSDFIIQEHWLQFFGLCAECRDR